MYTSKVEYDSDKDECFIILPDQLMEDMGIEVGDELAWELEGEKIYLHKK